MSLVRASSEALRCVLEQDTLWCFDDGPTVARSRLYVYWELVDLMKKEVKIRDDKLYSSSSSYSMS